MSVRIAEDRHVGEVLRIEEGMRHKPELCLDETKRGVEGEDTDALLDGGASDLARKLLLLQVSDVDLTAAGYAKHLASLGYRGGGGGGGGGGERGKGKSGEMCGYVAGVCRLSP